MKETMKNLVYGQHGEVNLYEDTDYDADDDADDDVVDDADADDVDGCQPHLVQEVTRPQEVHRCQPDFLLSLQVVSI